MQSLVYFIIWAGLYYLMMRFGCGAYIMGHGHVHQGENGIVRARRVSAGILYPFLGGLISHMFATAAMNMSSVSVITNDLRLRNLRP